VGAWPCRFTHIRTPRGNPCGYNQIPLSLVLHLCASCHCNLLPVPFILLFFDTISRLLSKVGFFERILNWLFTHTRRRGKIIERYERIGLALFVAIPLPVTGAWTGSLAAVLFGLKFKHALLSIFIGILIAGTIVTCATLLGWTVFGLWRA